MTTPRVDSSTILYKQYSWSLCLAITNNIEYKYFSSYAQPFHFFASTYFQHLQSWAGLLLQKDAFYHIFHMVIVPIFTCLAPPELHKVVKWAFSKWLSLFRLPTERLTSHCSELCYKDNLSSSPNIYANLCCIFLSIGLFGQGYHEIWHMLMYPNLLQKRGLACTTVYINSWAAHFSLAVSCTTSKGRYRSALYSISKHHVSLVVKLDDGPEIDKHQKMKGGNTFLKFHAPKHFRFPKWYMMINEQNLSSWRFLTNKVIDFWQIEYKRSI